MGLYSSGALGGVEVLDGGLVGGELTAHVLSAQAAAHAAATAAAAAHQQHQQQQIAVQQISEYLFRFHFSISHFYASNTEPKKSSLDKNNMEKKQMNAFKSHFMLINAL